ncbi:MAG: ATP-binding cassette domain-containing protein [Myxococcales bacterium]|nr:ATP-binding cassette domain-containing protein [Myxococcales bacterium]
MALFELRDITTGFDGRPVLRGLSLDIEAGEVVTLIGESGVGKTLLLKHMLGLMPIDSGTIRFDGQAVERLRERDWIAVRQRIGMLFQEGALFDSLSVEANIAYPLYQQTDMTDEAIRERVATALSLVGLPGIEPLWPASLSGGMRKRVALARAVAVHPEVIFYDEPTEGLDPINVTRVNRLLLGLSDALDATSVVATHNLKSACATSDRIVFLHEGVVHFDGSPNELRTTTDELVRTFCGNRDLGPVTTDA